MTVDLAANATPKAANVWAIGSGKGGVGKTWFSITLAHALAKASQKCLLFDADFGLANVHIQLGHNAERDLGTVIAGKVSLKGAVTRIEETGFDVVVGRSGSGSLANLPANRLMGLRSDLIDLAAGYDTVLIDLGAGVERSVRMISAQAGRYLVVTNDEPTALTDAYAFIKLTTMFDPDCDIRIVINMAESVREGDTTFQTLLKACQGFLKIEPKLAGIIRRDPKVKEAIRQQAPLLQRYPGCKAAEDVMAIAQRLRQG
ncbi:MAG: MinD/ParA family protein [Alphaproteobacteria bacterium]|nr:MinD/ParA family protein [Alphaproteobacteria bacterium]